MPFIKAATVVCAAVASISALGAADYPIRPADLTNVAVTAGFWYDRFETNRLVTVWADFRKCEETGRIENFARAARREQGTFVGCPFDDSDVFKVIEGAAYTLATHPDAKLEAYLDDLIAKIAGAQEPDGYLYTARTLGMEKVEKFPRRGMMGPERWSRCGGSHEFYNMGHMIEAGVAYYEATGKRSLLDVAIKAADLMDRTFGNAPGQMKRVPGHEEIELALCKLARATGEERYLRLAKTLLDFRGDGKAYSQNHLPVVKQSEAVGHAVRAGYLYTGMSDVAALMGDPAYRVASERLWSDVVNTKLHLNGGIGARHRGEAFGDAYELPNESAYLETCAAIANALWNERLFLFSGDGRYMDVIERIIYNGFLSGISISGDEFFYPNPLASLGGYKRSKWFGCSCCPVNIVRFIPQIAQYAYSTEGNAAYVNLFLASDAKLVLPTGTLTLSQCTDYPWKGTSAITVKSAVDGHRCALKIRIPGWAVGRPVPSTLYRQTNPASLDGVRIYVNGAPVNVSPVKGYCTIDRAWKAGDRVEVSFDMPVRRIAADDRVEDDRGRLAVERGPIVYCAEGVDNGGKVLAKMVAADAKFTETSVSYGGRDWPALRTEARSVKRGIRKFVAGDEEPFVLVPYFLWDHRDPGNEMQCWFPTEAKAVMSTAAGMDVAVSHVNPTDSVGALFDGVCPPEGKPKPNMRRFTFWDHRGTEEWIRVALPEVETMKGVEVYWFDDESVRGNCRAPASWKVQVRSDAQAEWADVEAEYPLRKDGWSRAEFKTPVSAKEIRLNVKLLPRFSSGAYEMRFIDK